MSRLVPLLILLLTLAAPAAARAKDKEPAETGSRATYGQRGHDDTGTFSSAERNLIRSWLLAAERREEARQQAAGLPPGLRKQGAHRQPLPAGWQLKLVRGEHIDQELYGWGTILPDDLLRRLPPPPPGSEILRIEDRIIRLDAAARTILDVFSLGGY